MGYWVRAGLGLALLAAGLGGYLYALHELMSFGTCASGGPYEIARECPEGTFETALLMPGGFIVAGIGAVVFALRGPRPGADRDAWRARLWLVGWSPLFIGSGVVALVAGLGSDAPDAETARWTGIFLAAVFIPMGVVPLLGAWFGRPIRRAGTAALASHVDAMARRAAAPVPRTAAAAPGADPVVTASGDPVERLRRLGELRDAGVLSADEFAAAKSRILAEL